MNKPIWNKPHESLVDNDIHSFAQRYPSERARSGKWDQLCLKAIQYLAKKANKNQYICLENMTSKETFSSDFPAYKYLLN